MPTASGGRSPAPDELVEFYDPTDVFGDLADALAEAFPSVAPDLRGRGRRRPRTEDDGRVPTTRPTTQRGGGRADRVSMRLAAAELVESREILPGQWLQAYHAPELATRLAGRPVRPHPDRATSRAWSCAGRSRSTRPTPATGIITIHFRVDRARHGVVHPAAARRHGRPARPARAAVRGGPAQPPPAAHRRRPRDGRRPDARRRGDPRRPPGHAAVRGGERARGLPRRACCPTRSNTSSPPTTGRSATTAS